MGVTPMPQPPFQKAFHFCQKKTMAKKTRNRPRQERDNIYLLISFCIGYGSAYNIAKQP